MVSSVTEINKREDNVENLMYIQDIFNLINEYFAYPGCFVELLVFIFLISDPKNKSSCICSSYFHLLSIGYFVDLFCFVTNRLHFIPLNINFPLFIFINNIFQWYGSLIIGPWNIALCLNRLTAVFWYNKHKIWWSKKNIRFLLIFLSLYPFIVNGYSFLNIQCKIALQSHECIVFMKQGYYIVSISNGICALLSLGIGITTTFLYRLSWKQNSNFTSLQLKVERNMLVQSLFSSICFLAFCLTVASYPYYSALQQDPNYYIYFVINAFLVRFLFNVFHYSSFVLLIIYSCWFCEPKAFFNNTVMQIYFTCTYLLSLSVSVLTIISMVFAVVLRAVSFSTFPSALKLYAIICYIPIVFTVSIITMAYAIFYLIYDTENLAFISVANITNAYLTQMIRTFFFIFAFERIIANIHIENYTIANKVWFSWILTSFNILVTALFQTVINYGPISISFKFEVYTYTVLGTYFISFFVFAVLYYLNKRMYKLTAYRISLNKRHKILENLKLLHHVFPTILIYNLFAPLGSLITAFGFWLDFPPMPVSIFHIVIFHNLPHLIICLRLLFINLKNHKDSKIKNVMVVKNAMGEALPKTYKANEYFKDLQQQWK